MAIKKHILITAGGTGGHVFPALSIANALREKGHDVTWLGTRRGIESSVVPDTQIDIKYIAVEGLRGKSKASLLMAPFKLVKAVFEAYFIVRKIRPDCVIGFGGFVAGPGGIAAKLLRKPLIIHEQNSVAGLTNEWLAKFSTKILTGFPVAEGMPSDAIWVGNPVRQGIQPRKQGKRSRIRVLVIGGSQGAHSFNMTLPRLFAELGRELKIKHQSGRGKAKAVRSMYEIEGVEAKVLEFVDDMAKAYQWADLLVCRAGAMTIAECCASGKPALLIPYPFSAGDHQIKNAKTMVDSGAAELVFNKDIDSSEMLDVLQRLTSRREVLEEMGQCALKLHKPGATESVVKIVDEVMNA